MRLTKTLVIIFTMFFVLSCRKYRDDDAVSFKSPLNRIASHTWKIVWFGVDNQDSSRMTYTVNGKSYIMLGETVTLTKNDVSYGNVGTRYAAYGTPVNFDFWALHGAQLIGGKSTVSIDMAYGQYGFRVPPKQEWEILKLTDNEFHISTNFNLKHYEIFFEKV